MSITSRFALSPLLPLLAAAALLILSGCKSHETHDHGAAGTSEMAVMCPKCKTTWVPQVTDQGTKMQRVTGVQSMDCPDCNAMADAYLKDGKKVLHDCPSCKVSMVEVPPTKLSQTKGAH